jgi:hypothetical protein
MPLVPNSLLVCIAGPKLDEMEGSRQLRAWQQSPDIITYVKLGFPFTGSAAQEAQNDERHSSNPVSHHFTY